MIHARFPSHDLTFRNLGFSGDEVDTRLRSKGFGTPDEWLSGNAAPIGGREDNRFATTETRTDVIFAFFGYNESFAGEAGLDAFRTKLDAWLTHTLAQRYNGTSAPRVVLFSPIAHENLGNPDLPDGRENNVRLQLYSRAMSDVAAAHKVTFVDLFAPTARLYESTGGPMTMQGVHLNSAGNRAVAEMIDRSLFGDATSVPETRLAQLREAVADKNFYWFHRYRVTDGYSTYGDRAFLTFVRGNPRNVDAATAKATPNERRAAEQLRRAAAGAADSRRDDPQSRSSYLDDREEPTWCDRSSGGRPRCPAGHCRRHQSSGRVTVHQRGTGHRSDDSWHRHGGESVRVRGRVP